MLGKEYPPTFGKVGFLQEKNLLDKFHLDRIPFENAIIKVAVVTEQGRCSCPVPKLGICFRHWDTLSNLCAQLHCPNPNRLGGIPQDSKDLLRTV